MGSFWPELHLRETSGKAVDGICWALAFPSAHFIVACQLSGVKRCVDSCTFFVPESDPRFEKSEDDTKGLVGAATSIETATLCLCLIGYYAVSPRT